MAIPAIFDAWASIYGGSGALRSAIDFVHVGGLVGGGGCAIAADRAVLGMRHHGPERRAQHLTTVHRTHEAVLVGLALVVISGVLLFAADITSYLASTAFWIKMGLVALLLGNGVLLLRAERSAASGDDAGWRRLHRVSIVSLVLWFATTLAGVVVPNAL